MPCTISKTRKRIVKRELKKGSTKKAALLEAGYSKATAEHNCTTGNKLLNAVEGEIISEFDKSKITADYILQNLDELLEKSKKDKGLYNHCVKILDMFGRYKLLWKDNGITLNTLVISQEDKSELSDRLESSRDLPPTLVPNEVLNVTQPMQPIDIKGDKAE